LHNLLMSCTLSIDRTILTASYWSLRQTNCWATVVNLWKMKIAVMSNRKFNNIIIFADNFFARRNCDSNLFHTQANAHTGSFIYECNVFKWEFNTQIVFHFPTFHFFCA
jgi:hypothetical protein